MDREDVPLHCVLSMRTEHGIDWGDSEGTPLHLLVQINVTVDSASFRIVSKYCLFYGQVYELNLLAIDDIMICCQSGIEF